MKKALRWILAVLLTPMLLCMAAGILIYIPPVQRWLVQLATNIISEKTEMEVKVESLELQFPLDLRLKRLQVVQHPDTIVCMEHALVDLDLRHIMQKQLKVESILLEGGKVNLTLETSGVEEEDTSSTTLPHWFVGIRKVELKDCEVAFRLPTDSIAVEAGIRLAKLEHGSANLVKGDFGIKTLQLDAWKVRYDYGMEVSKPVNGQMDYNHLWFDTLQLGARNITYHMNNASVHGEITHGTLKERSGLECEKLLTHLCLDDNHLQLKELWMQTPHSKVSGKAYLRWNAFEPLSNEKLTADLRAHIGKKDVVCLAGSFMPKEMATAYPDSALRAELKR